MEGRKNTTFLGIIKQPNNQNTEMSAMVFDHWVRDGSKAKSGPLLATNNLEKVEHEQLYPEKGSNKFSQKPTTPALAPPGEHLIEARGRVIGPRS